ncbi:MAG: RNA polymerase factor sigma-54 [Pseudomonadota bacterium]
MAQAPQLQVRQSQSLVVTPQLQQAIKMLQLGTVELQAFVAALVEANPFLDFEDPSDQFEQDGPDHGDETPTEDVAEDSDDLGEWELDSESLADPDHWPEGGDEDLSLDPLDLVSDEISLRDQLESIITAATFKSPMDLGIARAMMESVDAAGYLTVDLTDLAKRLGVTPKPVQIVLTRLQDVATPAGLFARNLAECLRLQLEDRKELTAPMKALIDNLPLLGARDFVKLERACKVDRQTLSGLVQRLRRLDPKPGAQFGSPYAQDVIPDVIVDTTPDGNLRVRHHGDAVPMVRLARAYAQQVKRQARAGKERAFVRENVTNANWLIRALSQRARTILAVAEAIVARQEGFFRWGVEHLTPMVLREIASEIDMHESTISRVTAGKYLTCSRGVFELKYFFTTAISGNGIDHSASAVKARLRALIDGETQVLSDDALVKALQQEGIDLARRTVAKYRESMDIPSSVARRREKRLVSVSVVKNVKKPKAKKAGKPRVSHQSKKRAPAKLKVVNMAVPG